MKRWILIALLSMAPLAAWSQTKNYIMQAEIWAVCGSVTVQVGSNFWTFPGTWTAADYTSVSATLPANLAGQSITMTPNLGSCCNSSVNAECVNPATISIYGADGYYYSSYIIGPWECSIYYSELVNPWISEQACDHVQLQGAPGLALDWQVSSTGAAPWYTLSGGGYVTASSIASSTPLDPYAQLFARYIPYGRNTASPNESLAFPPSTSNVPFRLYHAAPALTLTPTNQLCASRSGVTITDATLVLPQVKVTFKKDDSALGIDTVYTSSTFKGKFFTLSPGNYEIAVRNWGGASTDVCPATYTFQITGTYPSVTITPTVTNETCYGPAGTGSISLVVGGAGTTAPYTFAWAHGPTSQNLSNLAGDQDYTVTVKDVNGCTGTKPIRVEEPDAIATTRAYVLTDVSCHVNTTGAHNDGVIRIEASGGTGTLQYRVAGSAYNTSYPGASDIGNLATDTYTVYVRDANLCEVSFAQTVLLSGPADITYTSVNKVNATCAGSLSGSITIAGTTGGAGSFQYALDGGAYQASNLFDHLAAGSHAVWIKDANSCRKDVSAPLTESSAITFGTIDVQPQSCAAVQDGSIAASATGGTGSLTYALEDQPGSYQSSGTFTALVAGSYSIYVKDGSGCGNSTSRIVTMKSAIAGGITVSQAISCHGQHDGKLDLTITGGGTAPYSFVWSDDNTITTEDRSALGTGAYTVTVTDSKTCKQTFSRTLGEPDNLTLLAETSDFNKYGIKCAGGSDGTIDLQVSGGTTPYRYTWTSGQAIEDLSSLPAGNYAVTVQDNHNCSTTLSDINIKAPAALTQNDLQATNILCNYLQNGSIEASGTGGAGSYQYALNGGAWQNSGAFTNLDAGAYTVQLRDGNSCLSATKSVSITKPSALVITTTLEEQTLCGQANGALGVSVSGGVGAYQYIWYQIGEASAIAATPTVTGLRSADYQIVIEDGNNCSTDRIYSINTSDGPQVTQTLLRGLTCHDSNDGAISVTIAGGLEPYKINWDIPGATGTSVDNLTGGDHWIEVRDGRDCRAKITYAVSAPAALQLNKTTTPPLCQGNSNGSIAVQAGGGNPGGYTYLWNTGETTATLENIKAGQYSVIVKDSKQCTLSENLILTDPAAYTVDAGGDRTICLGQKLTVQAPEGAATYLWTSDAGYENTGRSVVLTVPARYTLKVININGCEAEDRFTLGTSDDLLSADFLMASQAHVGDTVALVDISWPLPDNIGWTFPENVQVLSQDDAYAMVIFPKEGEYEVVLDTHLGECIDNLTKQITIEGEGQNEGGRVSASLVSSFEVYPNPNDGAFTIAIVFRESVDGWLTMVDLTGGRVFLTETLTSKTEYSLEPVFQNIPAGVYFLILRVKNKIFNKRIVIR